ncbi:MAG TPA: 2,3-bisphosphoglycerate-independent phosphoglycerate mutase [Gammaproteobacteria bacterium]
MDDHPRVPRRPVILIILDGFGNNPSKLNNAIEAADTPNLDAYFAHYPHTLIQASGPGVGLPDGQMGNSEVGHMTLGAGSVIHQDIVKIDSAISNGEFFKNPALLEAIQKSASRNRPIHLFGLVSDGGVHSQLSHLQALIQLCQQQGAKPLLHMITDGRDTAPRSALSYLPKIEPLLKQAGGAIGSIMGRYYAMDRDNRWERTELAWRAYLHGEGTQEPSAEKAIMDAYAKGESDEFILPVLLPEFTPMALDDGIICFNFRKDRPRQIIDAISDTSFNTFDKGNTPSPVVTCMMPYNKKWKLPFAFDSERPETCLGEVISKAGLKQFHCSETEKYPHVTYFFNGGKTDPFTGETQLLIPSPKIATYDLQPEMSAPEVADAVINAIKSNRYAFIVVNFANGDMVGHTAKSEAIIRAVEVLDKQAGRVMDAAVAKNYSIILTADHGNCEEMIDPVTGLPHTQHTMYPVPCMIIDKSSWDLSCNASLANIAPTVLQLMGLEKPAAMTSSSILLREKEPLVSTQNIENVASGR